MESICADIQTIPSLFPAGSFDCCISNPPYYSGGPASKRTPLARREDCCTIPELMAAAGYALKFGGDFFLVHKPERLAEIISCAAAQKLEAKRLCLVRHREGGSIALILLQLRKGANPGLTLEEWALHHADGTPTPLYGEIYHLNSSQGG